MLQSLRVITHTYTHRSLFWFWKKLMCRNDGLWSNEDHWRFEVVVPDCGSGIRKFNSMTDRHADSSSCKWMEKHMTEYIHQKFTMEMSFFSGSRDLISADVHKTSAVFSILFCGFTAVYTIKTIKSNTLNQTVFFIFFLHSLHFSVNIDLTLL